MKPYGWRMRANEITEIGKTPVAAQVVVKARARRARVADDVPRILPLCNVCNQPSRIPMCRACQLDAEMNFHDICDGCKECAPELFGVSVDTDDSPLRVPLMEIARG